MIGTTISHFRILDLLGKGGMGEVYRAEDTTLNRQVAIKVLPELLAHDPERLARFEREAKLLATLNHPNIATIYGLEEADGKRLLILELVEGETLAEKIKKGPIPVEEALHLALQITEGLEAAHEKGIIHRDLKPANIKLTPEGEVKILDFGLAKAFEEETPSTDASHSPTLTDQMTQAGVILGTAAYMSPEQSKGKAADKRADIWAFGGVLYEMLTGKRAFEGDTITVTLGAIIHKEPDWETLPVNIPSITRSLLRQCLKKDSHHRLQHIGDARIDIEEAISEPTSTSVPGVLTTQPGWKRALPWSIAGLMALTAGVAIWGLTRPAPPQPLKKFVITPPRSAPLVSVPLRNELAISPDGRRVAYLTAGGLYLRSVDELTARQIPGTTNSGSPFFSPDGESLAFFSSTHLEKVSLQGGTPIALCEAPSGGRFGSWVGNTIVFSGAGFGLYRVSAAGGEPEVLAEPDLERDLRYLWPEILPGGEAVVFTIVTTSQNLQTEVLVLDTGERKVLLEGSRQARYASSGHLVYEAAGTGNLMAVPFDLAKLEVFGDAVPILQGVRQTVPGSVDYHFSNEGTLVYVPAAINSGLSLVWVDRNGNETSLNQEARNFDTPHRISPDGKQVAVGILEEAGARNIWIYNFEADSFRNLTFEGRANGPLAWTPDGKWIIFRSTRGGTTGNLFRRLADGSRPAEQLTNSEFNQIPNSVSPDGSILAFQEERPETGRDIWIRPIEEGGEAQLLISSPGIDCCAQFSPDGRLLAYVSDEAGRLHVYVSPYPEADAKYLVSAEDGGGAPIWSPDGKEIFYLGGDRMERMMVVSVQTEPTFSPGNPRELFEGDYANSLALPGTYGYYDISPDGQQFLMVKEGEQLAQINVVLNWFEELKRLVPTD